MESTGHLQKVVQAVESHPVRQPQFEKNSRESFDTPSKAQLETPPERPIFGHLVPGVCDVSVTNACNATCGFCSFAYDKKIVTKKRWIDRGEFARALPILHRRGIRHVNFQGGEPTLHPEITGLVSAVKAAGMHPAVITNGSLLPQKITGLIQAGLGTLLISIDSDSMDEHEKNRGLDGLRERVRHSLAIARENGIPTLASVTVSRLVNYEKLPDTLRYLGFDGVTFSYPRRAAFGSSSLVFSESSTLIDFASQELLNALESIKALKKRFPVLNPAASIEDIQRHVRGEKERFECVGGHKYFYMDWDLNIWRCEAWSKPLGSVFDLDKFPSCRDRCTACIMSCYRDTSVMMHAGVAIEDALEAVQKARPLKAARLLFRKTVALSLRSVIAQLPQLIAIGGLRKRPKKA